MRGNAYLGVVLFSLTAIYLGFTAFRDLASHSGSKTYGLIIGITVALLISGLTAQQPAAVPLIYLQSYFFVLGVTLGVSTYSICTQPITAKRISLYFLIALAALVLNASYGTLFIFASIAAISVRSFSRRNYQLPAIIVLAAALVYVWNSFLLPGLGHVRPPQIGPVNYLRYNLAEVPFLIMAFGQSLLAGFHGDGYVFELTRDTLRIRHMLVFSAIALAYTAAILWALRSPRKVMVAGIIMLAMLLAAAAVPLTRWGGSYPYKLDATRYIFMYKFAAAAFVWALADAFGSLIQKISHHTGRQFRNFILIAIALAPLLATMALQFIAYKELEKSETDLATLQGDNELAVYMLGVDLANTFSLHRWFSGDNLPASYTPVINWLVAEEKNVFSPNYRGSPQLVNYKLARAIYRSANAKPAPLEMDEKNCFEHPGFIIKQAWNVTIEPSKTGHFYLVFLDWGNTKIAYPLRIGKQSFYGIFPSGKGVRLCFPHSTLVTSATKLPAGDKIE